MDLLNRGKNPLLLLMKFGYLVKNSLAKTLLRKKCQVRKKSTPKVTSCIHYIDKVN